MVQNAGFGVSPLWGRRCAVQIQGFGSAHYRAGEQEYSSNPDAKFGMFRCRIWV